MMRRIDLLPSIYAERRRQRRNLSLVIVAGLLVLCLLIGWWFWLGLQINDAEDELAQVQATNATLQAQIDELQRFAELDAEVQEKRTALQAVFAGDVDWPSILTELAMVVPNEVWLTNLTASAGTTEGASNVGTESAAIRIDPKEPFGRIQFTGGSQTMRGVGVWMLRLEGVREFFAVYLNNATATRDPILGIIAPFISFDSTLELSDRAASGRFQGQELAE